MDIDQVKRKRRSLETVITKLLNGFIEETGCTVMDIRITTTDVSNISKGAVKYRTTVLQTEIEVHV